MKCSLNNSRFLSPLILCNYLKEHNLFYRLSQIGESVKGNPIYSYIIGNGSKKILIWSQMHGNETTTTKALIDFWRYLESNDGVKIRNECILFMIPQLNPDGAEAYTRLNANKVDLNRDAINLSQPESRVLREVYEEFKPDYCFNLHGQRTIFTAGDTAIPATVSFLAPSSDAERSITSAREIAMKLIVVANRKLQQSIPNAIGRYDDSFNINCVGDYFTSQNTPTILYEAGHYKNDYLRVFTRERIFDALVSMSNAIATDEYNSISVDDYLEIPQNFKNLRDIEVRNLKILNEGNECDRVFIQFIEEKKDNDVVFIPKIDTITTNQSNLVGLRVIDAAADKELINRRFDFDANYNEASAKLISLLNID